MTATAVKTKQQKDRLPVPQPEAKMAAWVRVEHGRGAAWRVAGEVVEVTREEYQRDAHLLAVMDAGQVAASEQCVTCARWFMTPTAMAAHRCDGQRADRDTTEGERQARARQERKDLARFFRLEGEASALQIEIADLTADLRGTEASCQARDMLPSEVSAQTGWIRQQLAQKKHELGRHLRELDGGRPGAGLRARFAGKAGENGV